MDAWQGGWREGRERSRAGTCPVKLARLVATRGFFFLAISTE
jgi:hypothetical protein